jgi:hypothetical protein
MRIRQISSFFLGAMVLGAVAVIPAHSQMQKGDPPRFGVNRTGQVRRGRQLVQRPLFLPNWAESSAAWDPDQQEEKRFRSPTRACGIPIHLHHGHGHPADTRGARQPARVPRDGGFLFINDSYGMDPAVRAMVRTSFPSRSRSSQRQSRVPQHDHGLPRFTSTTARRHRRSV